ncbi:MAG: phosphotransferase [Microlunatus sp.]|nr:phosphotransferase [Microlunatus sp.]
MRTRAAVSHWHLTLSGLLTGGTRSVVYGATDPAGRDLVLKITETRAGTRTAAAAEAAALTAWQSTGAVVRLVDATEDALLLVRARPGTLMGWSPDLPVDELVEVAAELLGRIWAVRPGEYPYPTLAEVHPEDDRIAREDAEFEQRVRGEPDRGVPGLLRLPAARRAAEELIRSTATTKLLHGDFITKNLVADDTSPVGWTALDPLPMIGDPAAEVAAFAAYQPAARILPIAEALAACAGVDVGRALRWTAIKVAHQAAQAWRDDQSELDQLVGSPAISTLLVASRA